MKRPKDECRICGSVDTLSFEHTPPKSAFNNRRVIVAKFEDIIKLGPDKIIRGKIEQKGMGVYSLCEKCNNNTGAWYGNRFVAWCYQGIEILLKTGGRPKLIYLHYMFPLAIIKQIIVMFFTVNHPGFNKPNPELVSFVLNKKRQYLPKKYRIFVYYNIKGGFISTGVVWKGSAKGPDPLSNKPIVLSEMNYPPFGYVMTYDGSIPDDRLVEITHFANYDYQAFCVMSLDLPVLPTHMWFPTDYRTKEEIEKDYNENIRKHPIL